MAPRLRSGKPLPRHQAGFGFLLVLLLITLLGIGLAAAGTLWRTESQRIKESELLYVGEQYRKALENYYRTSPGPAKRYPVKMEELLLDPRITKRTRHLRKLYRDPMTGEAEWGMIIDPASKEIRGVYSLAPGRPMKQQGFKMPQTDFANAKSYEAWRFIAMETQPPAAKTSKPGVVVPGSRPQPADPE